MSPGMDRHYEQVRELHTAFGVAMADRPTELTGAGNEALLCGARLLKACSTDMRKAEWGQVMFRAALILEELSELMQAETIEDQADALADILYLTIGTFTVMGLKPEAIFDIVHEANMKKLGPDGKPIFEGGKFTKPPGWKENHAPEPHIKVEIQRQLLVARYEAI